MLVHITIGNINAQYASYSAEICVFDVRWECDPNGVIEDITFIEKTKDKFHFDAWDLTRDTKIDLAPWMSKVKAKLLWTGRDLAELDDVDFTVLDETDSIAETSALEGWGGLLLNCHIRSQTTAAVAIAGKGI